LWLYLLTDMREKKNITLALAAFRKVLDLSPKADMSLIIAGGYSVKNTENVEYLKELQSLAKKLQIEDKVKFLTSISNEERNKLLVSASCLMYTPENEHFGIVPVEAGLAKTVVLACNSGGPMETIIDGETGFLLPQVPEEWAKVILALLQNPDKIETMGEKAKEHVLKNFSNKLFVSQLNDFVIGL